MPPEQAADPPPPPPPPPEVKSPAGESYSIPPPTGPALSFRLCESKTRLFVLSAPAADRRRSVLHIEREGPELVFWEEANSDLKPERLTSISARGDPEVVFYGILGFIKLLTSYFMCIVTHRRLVGHIAGHEIYAVEGVQYVSVSSAPVPADVRRQEDKYLNYLTQNDLTRDCYFSYSYQLARPLQTNMGGCPPADSPAAERAAKMFTWNHNLLHGGKPLTLEASSTRCGFIDKLRNKSFALQTIHGFFEQRTLSILSRQVLITLIARRSRHFAGTR
ncbi:SacI homology domain-containing protein, partial [Baffinella frigidus]